MPDICVLIGKKRLMNDLKKILKKAWWRICRSRAELLAKWAARCLELKIYEMILTAQLFSYAA